MTSRFRYRAATADGQLVEGTLEAQSRHVALDELHRRSLYPVEVDVASAGSAGRSGRMRRRTAVAVWTRNLSILLGAGVPLERALAFTGAHTGNDALADVVRQLRRSVQEGASFADALASHPTFFPPLFVAMVSAGEMSGALDIIFARLSDHVEEASELRSQVLGALLYPALMAVVATVGVGVLLIFVIPRFAAMLAEVGGKLPLTTRLLLGVSNFLAHWWWIWVPLVVAVVYAAYAWLHSPDGRRRFHAARLNFPVTGDLELKYTTARFARTLALLLRSGVPIMPSLRIARNSATNSTVSTGIDRAAVAVARGDGLATALGSTLPPLALQMLAVGEESGRLEELCTRIADTYDGEVRRTLRTSVAMIEPAMIILFGAIVGFVALAMLQAIYSINTTAF